MSTEITKADEVGCCSFCGKASFDCKHLHRGPRAAICSDCVIAAVRVMLHGWEDDVFSAAELAQQQADKDAERAKPWLEMRAARKGTP